MVATIKEVESLHGVSRPPFVLDKPEDIAWPRHAKREPLPQTVPANIAQDYEEAAMVFSDSPKAGAALSRRCLQHVLHALRDQGYNQHDLFDQIKLI
jgi:hypothetical protein